MALADDGQLLDLVVDVCDQPRRFCTRLAGILPLIERGALPQLQRGGAAVFRPIWHARIVNHINCAMFSVQTLCTRRGRFR